ncbi:MAG TPA: phosphopentomutase [Bacillota bacterium]|nr:phosphopentomutase [Bacillota bacterium]
MVNARVALFVLDSLGVGELPDAGRYGDTGSNTLGNIARAMGGLKLPNLGRLGLGNIIEVEGVPPAERPLASFGKMAEQSAGKDTTTGHWEIAGIILEKPFPVYPYGFPEDLIREFENRIGRKVLGNKAASGTEIIEELGADHMATGSPIVYTSADSVFQVAAHEEVIPVEQLYHFCKIARDMLTGEHAVGRVIARPFAGKPGSIRRTERRHDFSVKPSGKTLLDTLKENGIPVTAVGKIWDIFAGRGITASFTTRGNRDGLDCALKLMRQSSSEGLVFTNLVDFDMLYGHRNDPRGYARALEELDGRIAELIEARRDGDVIIITADHGCDPTTPGTDHTREYVPLLVMGDRVKAGVDLGIRETFADVAATVACIFSLKFPAGKSFWDKIKK